MNYADEIAKLWRQRADLIIEKQASAKAYGMQIAEVESRITALVYEHVSGQGNLFDKQTMTISDEYGHSVTTTGAELRDTAQQLRN